MEPTGWFFEFVSAGLLLFAIAELCFRVLERDLKIIFLRAVYSKQLYLIHPKNCNLN